MSLGLIRPLSAPPLLPLLPQSLGTLEEAAAVEGALSSWNLERKEKMERNGGCEGRGKGEGEVGFQKGHRARPQSQGEVTETEARQNSKSNPVPGKRKTFGGGARTISSSLLDTFVSLLCSLLRSLLCSPSPPPSSASCEAGDDAGDGDLLLLVDTWLDLLARPRCFRLRLAKLATPSRPSSASRSAFRQPRPSPR